MDNLNMNQSSQIVSKSTHEVTSEKLNNAHQNNIINIDIKQLEKSIISSLSNNIIKPSKTEYDIFLETQVHKLFHSTNWNSLNQEVKEIMTSAVNDMIKNQHEMLNVYTLMKHIFFSKTGQKIAKRWNINLYQLQKKCKEKENNYKSSITIALNILALIQKIQNKNEVNINILLLACLIVEKVILSNLLFPNGFNKIKQYQFARYLLDKKYEKLSQNYFIFKLESDTDLLNNSNHPYAIRKFMPKTLVDNIFFLCMEKEFALNEKAYEEYKLSQRYFENEFNTLLKNTRLSFYNSYSIEFIKDEKKKDYDKRVKPFVAAGTCYYNDKISMNINEINNTKKWGTQWSKLSIKNVFFHELGHAVDEAWRQNDFINYDKSHSVIHHRYSQNDFLNDVIKQCVKNFKCLSKKNKEKLAYYIKPSYIDQMMTKLDSKEIESTPHLKEVKTMTRKYSYKRSKCEGFAECFSKIVIFLLNGYNEENYFAETRDYSSLRQFVHVMKPMLLYLFNHIDWLAIGVPKRNLVVRKIEFRRMLDHLDKMPQYNSKATEFSSKVHRQKKMLKDRYK
jgi:hypothetical protein